MKAQFCLTPFQQVVFAGIMAIYLRSIESNRKRAQRIAYQIAVEMDRSKWQGVRYEQLTEICKNR